MEVALWICLFCLQGFLLADGQNCVDVNRDGTKDQDIMSKTRLKRESNLSQTGAISVKGIPNILIQGDRSRRHLSSNKRKLRRKSRVGSFSLLSNNNPASPLQVTRVKRDDRTGQKKGRKTRRQPAKNHDNMILIGLYQHKVTN
ncbi:uncharacterized protein si:dkey-12l12.1 isoform X2 [Sardina pilchardus]|uniref:uncharacterized protein si:dkey-12l12.1 isoform X1 n=1 Tax=Sardina pilchardus TaxID=27697 RepID=UPI002E15A7B4